MEFLKGYKIEYSKIRDPIYGFIEIPLQFKEIIDHVLFQRLRRINQLPLEDMVYPSSKQSRFEHSIGTMYLSMLVAANLLQNSKENLKAVFKDSKYLKYINSPQEKEQTFILASGLVGLLHDIGHGPFSHTLEYAVSELDGFEYDHEKVGLEIIEHMKTELKLEEYTAFNIAIEVLNKNNKYDNLDGLGKILKNFIDHELIDVDKGDYLLRDSYHCGVPYGIYDFTRLWSLIELVADEKNGFVLAFNEKVASEIWSLRFARFNMHKNVYKHHIRQITDAHLIDIIKTSIEEKGYEHLIPINPGTKRIDFEKFIFWTDDDLLKNLSSIKKETIDKFLARHLFKRTIYISSSKNIIKLNEMKSKILEELNETFKNINSSDILIYKTKKVLPPVNEHCIQNIKIIFSKNYKSTVLKSIAEYFEFKIEEVENQNQYLYTVFLNKDKKEAFSDQELNNFNRKIEKSISNFCDPNLFTASYFKG